MPRIPRRTAHQPGIMSLNPLCRDNPSLPCETGDKSFQRRRAERLKSPRLMPDKKRPSLAHDYDRKAQDHSMATPASNLPIACKLSGMSPVRDPIPTDPTPPPHSPQPVVNTEVIHKKVLISLKSAKGRTPLKMKEMIQNRSPRIERNPSRYPASPP